MEIELYSYLTHPQPPSNRRFPSIHAAPRPPFLSAVNKTLDWCRLTARAGMQLHFDCDGRGGSAILLLGVGFTWSVLGTRS